MTYASSSYADRPYASGAPAVAPAAGFFQSILYLQVLVGTMSGLQKNVASQKWKVFSFDRTDGTPKTGDAANITAKIAKDWAAAGATNDVNPTEVEDGYYVFDLTQPETNADVLDLYPESSTGDIQVIGVPGTIFTVAENFPELGIESDGDLTKVNTLNGHTAQTADHAANISAIVSDTNELQTDWTNGGRLDLILDAVLAMLDDARAEPGQGAPPVNPDSMTKLDYLYKSWRNKKDNDGSTTQLYDDAGTTVDQKQATSESAGTVTKAEWVTGP